MSYFEICLLVSSIISLGVALTMTISNYKLLKATTEYLALYIEATRALQQMQNEVNFIIEEESLKEEERNNK